MNFDVNELSLEEKNWTNDNYWFRYKYYRKTFRKNNK